MLNRRDIMELARELPNPAERTLVLGLCNTTFGDARIYEARKRTDISEEARELLEDLDKALYYRDRDR